MSSSENQQHNSSTAALEPHKEAEAPHKEEQAQPVEEPATVLTGASLREQLGNPKITFVLGKLVLLTAV